MHRNLTKAKLSAGQPVFGLTLSFPSEGVVELCGYLGFDFVMIDAEHSAVNEAMCEHLVRAAEVAGITPIVRVPHNERALILRYLETGAQGVQVPHISSRADAEAAVRAARYHPEGERGLAGSRWADFGATRPLGEYIKFANEQIMVNAMVEDAPGLKNLAEIVAVPGVDAVFIGPTDLSQALGVPGQTKHPSVVETIDQMIKQIRAAGKVVGIAGGDAETSRMYVDKGALWITTSPAYLLTKAGREYLRAVRG